MLKEVLSNFFHFSQWTIWWSAFWSYFRSCVIASFQTNFWHVKILHPLSNISISRHTIITLLVNSQPFFFASLECQQTVHHLATHQCSVINARLARMAADSDVLVMWWRMTSGKNCTHFWVYTWTRTVVAVECSYSLSSSSSTYGWLKC